MNSWANEHFLMHNNMMPPMLQNAIPSPMTQAIPHMSLPPEFPIAEAPNPNPAPLIGPIIPEGQKVNEDSIETVEMQISGNDHHQSNQSKSNRNGRDRNDRRDRERERGANKRRRSRSHDRNRFDRHDRPDRPERLDRPDRIDRNRNDRRERRTHWDSSDANSLGTQQMAISNNMVIPGAMMPYGNMMPNMLGQQQMEMSNIGHIGNMANVPNMPNMGNLQNMPNMMTGMQMMSNMMMNQQGQMPIMANQQIFLSKGILLPPIPGVTTPSRREQPPGCRTIFVGGMPNGITDDVINEIFHRFGTIDDVKLHRQGVCHVRFERKESVDLSFALSGYRFKYHEQGDNEATTMFIDYALNRDDQNEYEKKKRRRESTPPRVENFTSAALNSIGEKIKSDNEFVEAAPTLAFWLEHGECNKKNSNTFYSLIQASNNQIRRLFNEKMLIDDEFQTMKTAIKDKFAHIILQFEQVAKILSAAKHQRASDHFSKQQRRNIEMWLKMTEEVDNIKEEYNTIFDDEESEKVGKNMVPQDKYEELKAENENLTYELEGYKNEAYLAKDEAERKFEKFKAYFIAQQALQNKQPYLPLPSPPMPTNIRVDPPLPVSTGPVAANPKPPPPTPDDNKVITTGPVVPPSEAKLISILTAFLMVHPLGASVDYLVSYVRSMVPQVTQATVQQVLQKYNDVFQCKTSGVGASIEHRWCFTTFDLIKADSK